MTATITYFPGVESTRQVDTIYLIDPDAKSWSGHYMAYNEKLSAQLAGLGITVKVICRKDLAKDILASRPNYIPYLSTHSWEVANRKENQEYLRSFESEILAALARIHDPQESEALLYLYCGSLEHARVLTRVQERHPFLRINVNLFYLPFRIGPEYIGEWKYFVEWLDGVRALGGRLIVTVPTAELRDQLADLTGCAFPVAPHPSTGVTDEAYHKIERRLAEKKAQMGLQVLFPSSPRLDKGYLLSVGCARRLGDVPGFTSAIRHSPTFSTQHGLDQPLENLPANAKVIEGELSDEEFITLFVRSDIVVLPYTPDAFAMRTSGLLIDSLYHRIPAVVIEGTWLAGVVHRYGCGVVVERADIGLLADAVRKIANHLAHYRERAKAAADEYFGRNSWQVFGQFLLHPYGAEGMPQPAASLLSGTGMDIFPWMRSADGNGKFSRIFHPVPALGCSRQAHRRKLHWLVAPPDKKIEPMPRPSWLGDLSPLDSRIIRYSHTIPGPYFAESTGNCWRCDNPVEVGKFPWMLVFDVASPLALGFVGGLRLRASAGMQVQVSLGRFGKEPYEGISQLLELEPDVERCVFLEKEFSRQFPAIKLQVEIRDLRGKDSADLTIDQAFVQDRETWAFRPAGIARSSSLAEMRVGAMPAEGVSRLFPLPVRLAPAASDPSPVAATGWKAEPVAGPAFLRDQTPPSASLVSFSHTIPGDFFKALEANRWRYEKPMNDIQAMWIVVFNLAGSSPLGLVGGVRVSANRALRVRVSLGRFGNEPYEGASKTQALKPDEAHTLALEKVFSRRYSAVKLQLEILDLAGADEAEITIDQVFLNESQAGVAQRIGNIQADIETAHRYFRAEEYMAALCCHLQLADAQPSKLHEDGVLKCARRMGWGDADTLEAIRHRLSV